MDPFSSQILVQLYNLAPNPKSIQKWYIHQDHRQHTRSTSTSSAQQGSTLDSGWPGDRRDRWVRWTPGPWGGVRDDGSCNDDTVVMMVDAVELCHCGYWPLSPLALPSSSMSPPPSSSCHPPRQPGPGLRSGETGVLSLASEIWQCRKTHDVNLWGLQGIDKDKEY